jgi:hypothetical protein
VAKTMIDTPAGAVAVEYGTGSLKKVLEDKGRNQQLEITADGLQHPVKGWMDKTNPELAAAFEKVRTEWGGRMAYRIDTSRAPDVAADVPWADIPTVKKFRRIVAIRPELELAQLVPAQPAMATAGAPAKSAASPASAAPSAPPAAAATNHGAPPSQAVTAAHGARVCVSCGEGLAGRPVKKVPNGYVHTDADCLEAPFADKPTTTQWANLVDQPPAQMDQAKAQAIADEAAKAAGVAVTVGMPRPEGEDDDGVYRCELCAVETSEGREAHEAGPVHQGKARQHAQADDLAARRQANVAEATRFDDAPHPVKLAPVPLPSRGARVEEGKAWEEFNSDGSVNIGSFRMQANLAGVNWAQRLLVERARIVAGETGTPAAIDPGQLRSLARELLELSDRIQASIRADGRSNRMDNSHTRARSALSTALHVYPVPFGADEEVKVRWREEVVAWAVLCLRMALELDQ